MLSSFSILPSSFFFFFNDTATTEIYTLSLHDALPICFLSSRGMRFFYTPKEKSEALMNMGKLGVLELKEDRKSTRLNSSHVSISYAVFCLKKKSNIPV